MRRSLEGPPHFSGVAWLRTFKALRAPTSVWSRLALPLIRLVAVRLEIASADSGQRDSQDGASGAGNRERDLVVLGSALATVDEGERDAETFYAVEFAHSYACEGIEWCKGRWLFGGTLGACDGEGVVEQVELVRALSIAPVDLEVVRKRL